MKVSLRVLIGEEDCLEDGRIGRSTWEREAVVDREKLSKHGGSVVMGRGGLFCRGHTWENISRGSVASEL